VREKVDTGEFINPDVGFQHAIAHDKQQAARIQELEEAVFRLARRLHQGQHSSLTSMRDCTFSMCHWARLVLRQ